MNIDERLVAIEARANAATPGPWEQFGTYVLRSIETCNCGGYGPSYNAHEAHCGLEPVTQADEADAEFIAAARQDVPALVAEVRRLRGDVVMWQRAAEAERDAAAELRIEIERLRAQVGELERQMAEAADNALADVQAEMERVRVDRDRYRQVQVLSGSECLWSQRANGLHSWRFDGDDPRITCVWCGEIRDGLTGAVLLAGRRA